MRLRTVRAGTPWLAGLIIALLVFTHETGAQGKAEKAFNAVITDTQGVETDVKNVTFYWKEKISETAFVPHELRQLPVKRGTATVQVKFDTSSRSTSSRALTKDCRLSALPWQTAKAANLQPRWPAAFEENRISGKPRSRLPPSPKSFLNRTVHHD